MGNPRYRYASRGHRARKAKREEARRRQAEAEGPLTELVSREEPSRDSRGRRRRKPDSAPRRLTLGHIAFLLLGLALGASLMLGLGKLAGRRPGPAPPTESAEGSAAVAPRGAPPAETAQAGKPAVLRPATSPVEAVRLMLQASLDGDTAAAYAQWEIAPDETATIRSGQTVTLAEATALLGAAAHLKGAGKVRVADFEFSVKTQAGDEAEVLQKRGEEALQVYSLHRRDGTWKIRYASSP